MSWPAVARRSSAEDEYHEDPVSDLCLTGLPDGTGPATGPTRPPDVVLPLHDPDWRFESLDGVNELPAMSQSTDSGVVDSFSALTPEEQELRREEWRQELAKINDDIQLMRETLLAKMKQAQELKQKLGITMWTELQHDVNESIQTVKDSQAYQRTGAALRSTGERASGLLSGLGAKLSEARESTTFKSMEERMGTMVTSVKSKVGTPHSNSTQSFDEALREAEAAKKQAEGAAPAPAENAAQ